MPTEINEVETTETEAARFPAGAALGAFTGKQLGGINGDTTWLKGGAVGSEATPPNDTEDAAELLEEDNAPISREAFLRRLRRAIDDAYSWIDYAEEFGAEIENGGKVKRTKLAANVTRNRLSILTSSLNDVRYAKVAD